MKGVVFIALFGFVCGTFLDFLKEVEQHSSFRHLSQEDKLLFAELVQYAEESPDGLKNFLDRTDISDTIKLLDHLNSYDSLRFAAYLAEHQNWTHHTDAHQSVIHRRDDDDDDDHHHHHSNLIGHLEKHHFDDLPSEEREVFDGLRSAAHARNVTAFVHAHPGAVFALIEWSASHSTELMHFLEQAMNAEAAPANLKRQSSHDWHHSNHNWQWSGQNGNFTNFWTNTIGEGYYETLPEEERKVYHDIKAALEAGNLRGYFDEYGYGPLFGLYEHLDIYHKSKVEDFLVKALAEEDAAAAAAAAAATK